MYKLTMQVSTSNSPVRRVFMRNGKTSKRNMMVNTYPREEYKHGQSEMGSENDGKVNGSILHDGPDDPREPELPAGRRGPRLVSRHHDDDESAGIKSE